MANSSDWLTALLDRAQEPLGENGDVEPEGWLSELAAPVHAAHEGFVGGLPFDRPTAPVEPPFKGDTETSFTDGLSSGGLRSKGSNSDGSGENSGEMNGDELVDILREALGEDGQAIAKEPDPTPEPNPNPNPDPEDTPAPDPIAQAYASGEAAGRLAVKAEHEAGRKLELRQSFRALDQAAMDALAGELAETVISLCSQTLSDFVPAPDALKSRCLEAARKLGAGAGDMTLYLHPDDLLLIDKEGLGSWSIIGDPTAERGGIRFETEDGSISDRPSDWRRAIAAAIRG